jgi:archaellum component FlaG (FlaF/FlaG flagellin family)
MNSRLLLRCTTALLAATTFLLDIQNLAHASDNLNEPGFDLSKDFSITQNPAGPWAYGYKTTKEGTFTAYTRQVRNFGENGVAVEKWIRPDVSPSEIQFNATTNIVTANGGQEIIQPGDVILNPGFKGQPDNFGAVRFTVPAGAAGIYQLSSAVTTYIKGPLSGDSDYHIVFNGQEIWGEFIASNGSGGYSGYLNLASGDTLDFLVGRGADDELYASGLTISVHLARAQGFDLQRDFSVVKNPNGPWQYGYKTTVTGEFGVYTLHVQRPGENGVYMDKWIRPEASPSEIQFNNTTNAIITNSGQQITEPGTVILNPGITGNIDNFGAIRFTVPSGSGGRFILRSSVRPYIDGPISGDSDFHVVLNGAALWDEFVGAHGLGGYTNVLNLNSGDVLDFLVGRGADESAYASGLKIAVNLAQEDTTGQVKTLVVPNYFVSHVGVSADGFLNHPLREQQIYDRSQFPNHRITIQEIRLRPYSGQGAFTGSIGHIAVRLATTGKSVADLSYTYADNLSANLKTTFDGPLSISSTATVNPQDGTKAFDIRIPFQENFVYDPAEGNLVVEVLNYTGMGTGNIADHGVAPELVAARRFSLNPADTTAFDGGPGVVILQMVYTDGIVERENPPIILPSYFADHAGSAGDAMLNLPCRVQQVHDQSEFTNKPIFIREIRYRPWTMQNAFTGTVGRLVVNLSTTSKTASNLSPFFSENTGPDVAGVFDGPLSVSSASMTDTNSGAKQFDIRIPLKHGFLYDPSKGNLLVEVQTHGGLGHAGLIDRGVPPSPVANRIVGLSPTAAKAVAVRPGVAVLELIVGDAGEAESSVTLTPASRQFTNSILITAQSSGSGGSIRYTLNGSIPTLDSAVFPEGGVELTASAQVRAQLFVNGQEASAIASATYQRVYPDDQLPAAWREKFFGAGYLTDPRSVGTADPDGDGQNNYQEYLAQTHPLSKASVLKVTSVQLVPLVRWSSVPGVTYQVQRLGINSPNNWINLQPVVKATSTSSTFFDFTGTRPDSSIYRVIPLP